MKELLRTEYEKGRADALAEKKPVDKVEPKFKVGDWLIRNDMVGVSCCITQIHEPYYYSTTDHTFISFREEDKYRLWTIQDARDGDVLVSQSQCGLGTWYGIFKSLDDNESMTVRCYLAMDGRFETRKEWCFDKDVSDVKPATKEQRERFFAAMLDAGYEWDADKKELKKIEQDPAWSEEDEKTFNKSVEALEELGKEITKDKETATKFLKSAGIMDENGELAEPYRVCESTSNWSEEDKNMVRFIGNAITANEASAYLESKGIQVIDAHVWLEKLKDRYSWKPSKRQMEQLGWIAKQNKDNMIGKELMTLYNDLKKLRNE